MSQFYNTGVEGQFERYFDIDIETTTRCNAACPMCFRNLSGDRINPNLNIEDFNTDWIDNIDLTLGTISLCGNYGDPIMVNNLHQVLHDLNKKINWAPDHKIIIMTNGGARTTDWWKELASIMKTISVRSRVVFGIDGLEDTNHLYRRNVNWNKLMKNVEAYISAGGRATWKMILFKHNQHQVEEAKKLANDMGFKEFRIRKTARFTYSPDGPDKWRVQDKNKNIEYYLQPPTNKNYYNAEQDKWTEISKTEDDKQNYLNTTNISCLYKNKFKRIYVNAYADIFPCCYISNDVYPGKNAIVKDSYAKIFNRYEKNFNSLRHRRWEDILEHQFFENDIETSWNKDLENGRLMRCARTCGGGFKPITTQSQTEKINQ